MKDKKTHINMSVDEETLSLLSHLATENKLSLTHVAQQLLEEAIEQREDDALVELAEKRLCETREVISHEEAWRK